MVAMCCSRVRTAVRLRLTIFPAKKGHSHKRQDIRISNPQSLQIVSENFVNRNVLLIQSDSDYYISTDSKNVLVDWVATLKAALAKKPGGELSFDEEMSVWIRTLTPGPPEAVRLVRLSPDQLRVHQPVLATVKGMSTRHEYPP